MGAEKRAADTLRNKLTELGPSESINRFLSRYGNVRTKSTYAIELALFIRWLKTRGVKMTPDELIKDNLICVFKSDPVDVQTKRRHTGWLSEYINVYMIQKDYSEPKRTVAASAIRGFYKANDSELFGSYATANQPVATPAKPLFVEDIRKVLLAMPLQTRTPCLIAWQSSIEINRVISTKFPEGPAPLKVDLYGRKGHRKHYWTYLGRDSVEHLAMLGDRGFSQHQTILKSMHRAARRLASKGLLKNPDVRSYHPHALRHSFASECSHAGVRPEIREFMMGHIAGVSWVYQHPELHEEDVLSEYGKVEPYVSLNPGEAIAAEKFADREKQFIRLMEKFQAQYDELKRELEARGVLRPSP